MLVYLAENSIPLSRLVGLGRNGTAAMIGRISGVATRLKQKQPALISIHCCAHRLALAAGQAGEKVPFPSTLIFISQYKHSIATLMASLLRAACF